MKTLKTAVVAVHALELTDLLRPMGRAQTMKFSSQFRASDVDTPKRWHSLWQAKVALALAILGGVTLAYGQSNDNANRVLGNFLRTLQGSKKPTDAVEPGSTPSTGYLDTPENLQKVLVEARNRSAAAYPNPSGDCSRAAARIRPGRIAGTGYLELLAKCEAEIERDIKGQQDAVRQAEQRRAQNERTRNDAARHEADDYSARRAQMFTDLKAGNRPPRNCAQWMIAKGFDSESLARNEVSKVAYRSPNGQGYFKAAVTQIEGETLLASVDGDHSVIVGITASTNLFNENQLKVNATVAVVGIQAGTRTLKRADGSEVTLAVVMPFCLGAAPAGLLDLAP